MTPDELRALRDAATPGPWSAQDFPYGRERHWYCDGPEVIDHDGGLGEADARLIALAPTLATLVADMAEALAWMRAELGRELTAGEADNLDALLSRLTELGP